MATKEVTMCDRCESTKDANRYEIAIKELSEVDVPQFSPLERDLCDRCFVRLQNAVLRATSPPTPRKKKEV